MNQKIVLLNATLRDAIEFRAMTPEEEQRQNGQQSHLLRNSAIGVGGAGALGAGGLYLRGSNVAGPVRPGFQGVMDTMGKGASGFIGDATAGKNWAGSKLGAARDFAGNHWDRTGKYLKAQGGLAKGAGKGLWEYMKSVGGFAKSIKYSSRNTGVISLSALNAKLRDVIEFKAE